MAELMNRGLGALPPTAVQYAKGFMGVGAVLPVLEALCPAALGAYLPSGMSMGVGMYLTADYVLPRVAGALLVLAWRAMDQASHDGAMLAVASGFVLGEGVWSMVQLGLKTVAGH